MNEPMNESANRWDSLKHLNAIEDQHQTSLLLPRHHYAKVRMPEGFTPGLCLLFWPRIRKAQLFPGLESFKAMNFPLFSLEILKSDQDFTTIVQMPVGAPAAALVMEALVHLGYRNFVGVSIAGGIRPDLKPQSLILADQAIVDEGTSERYGNREFFAHPSFSLATSLFKALASQGTKVHKGCIWTTDAPYRETPEKLAFMLKKQILAVDMETSALYTLARRLGVSCVQFLFVADLLRTNAWVASPPLSRVLKSLPELLQAVFAVWGDKK